MFFSTIGIDHQPKRILFVVEIAKRHQVATTNNERRHNRSAPSTGPHRLLDGLFSQRAFRYMYEPGYVLHRKQCAVEGLCGRRRRRFNPDQLIMGE